MKKTIISLVFLILLSCGLIFTLGFDNGIIHKVIGTAEGGKSPGDLIDPVRGLWGRARISDQEFSKVFSGLGLEDSTTISIDKRGVPHIYASNEYDAAFAMGFLYAKDRLFQLDFVTRVASGRLSEILGPSTIETDQYLRSLGMQWSAQKNLQRIKDADGIEWKALQTYTDGVNLGLDQLSKHQLPLEFHLLNYEPEPFSPLKSLLVMQFMAYDLSFTSDHTSYGPLQKMMHQDDFETLFPLFSKIYVPVVPNLKNVSLPNTSSSLVYPNSRIDSLTKEPYDSPFFRNGSIDDSTEVIGNVGDSSKAFVPGTEGFQDGYGSNNWVVGGSRTIGGKPILANDMHLRLTLPSIWYEMHIETPAYNVRGVTLPGIPSIVQGFNDYLSWGFTNSGTDQIDHYGIEVGEDDNYMLDGIWTPFELIVDSLFVKGEDALLDTLRITHLGPMIRNDSLDIAIQWTAHKSNRAIESGIRINQARNMAAFNEALLLWDCPAQNIVYADVEGNYSIRVTGNVPIRSIGNGVGVMDGSKSSNTWVGRIPFDQMPHSVNPEQGFLASANQQSTDDTYPYYLGFDWYQSYRSIRINDLLNSKEKHSVLDFKNYQSDLVSIRLSLIDPLLRKLENLPRKSEAIRDILINWSGNTDKTEVGPLVLFVLYNELSKVSWDEFEGLRSPRSSTLISLLLEEPNSKWLDIRSTQLKKENADDVLKLALNNTVAKLEREYGDSPEDWRWGDNHSLTIQHLTGSEQLKSFWRGPFSYGGMRNTLAPAGGLRASHGASWRFIADFNGDGPRALGINPGGQSGDPLSRLYDTDIPKYLYYQYNVLSRPSAEEINAVSTFVLN